MQYGPNPNHIYPNKAMESVCFIKNIITRLNMIVVGVWIHFIELTGVNRECDCFTPVVLIKANIINFPPSYTL